ncbi:MAG: hypothetical protein AAGU27_04000 [Dehalobacterium sp.]
MKKVFPAILLLLVVIIIAVPVFFTRVSAPRKDLPQSSSGYWVINMADNKTLTHTSITLSVGDQYIAADNKIYRITKIVEDKIYVEQIE